jgi:hypothetical protein
LAARHLGLVLLLLGLESFPGALLDLGLGRSNSFETLLAPRDLCGHVHAVRHCGAVGLLAQSQQGLHFLAQLRFDLVGVSP